MTSFEWPRPISASDEVAQFDCGERTRNNWLSLRAIRNEDEGNSRTYVAVERESGTVAGYSCLSANSLAHEHADGALRRNAPDPIPTVLIGRLAVNIRFTGLGLGSSLLQHALLKGIEAATSVGARAFLVDALNESAVAFYSRFDFRMLPGSARAMYLRTKDVLRPIAEVAPEQGRTPTARPRSRTRRDKLNGGR